MKVMIVEDNYFVADIMKQQIKEAGHEVVGPIYRIIDALMTLKSEVVDCAVLDVHLGPEGLVTPIAEALEAMNIPFVFVTGYPLLPNHESPLGRFANRVVLNKPYQAENLLSIINSMANNKGLRLVPGVYNNNHNNNHQAQRQDPEQH